MLDISIFNDRSLFTLFDRDLYKISKWKQGGDDILVFHEELSKREWLYTKLVLFAFLVSAENLSFARIQEDYKSFLAFSKKNKESFLPIGFHCCIVLLPIYLTPHADYLTTSMIRSQHTHRHSVFYFPSAIELFTRKLIRYDFRSNSLWIQIFRNHVEKTIGHIARGAIKSIPPLEIFQQR